MSETLVCPGVRDRDRPAAPELSGLSASGSRRAAQGAGGGGRACHAGGRPPGRAGGLAQRPRAAPARHAPVRRDRGPDRRPRPPGRSRSPAAAPSGRGAGPARGGRRERRDGQGRARRRGDSGPAALEVQVHRLPRPDEGQVPAPGLDQGEHALLDAAVDGRLLGGVRLAVRGGAGAVDLRPRDGARLPPDAVRREGRGADVHSGPGRGDPGAAVVHRPPPGCAGGSGRSPLGPGRGHHGPGPGDGHRRAVLPGDRPAGGVDQPVQPDPDLAARRRPGLPRPRRARDAGLPCWRSPWRGRCPRSRS